MSGTSAIFNGSSRYSADFQSVVDRTVNAASLPMMQMQNVKNELSNRSSALASLDSKVSALQTAVSRLSSGLGLSSFASSVSDTSTLRATTSDGIREGSYSIEITDLGSNAASASKATGTGIQAVTSPSTQSISADTTFKLYLNTADPEAAITVTPASNNLNSLADAINGASSDVHATVVNLGSSESPDYRLSIQHNKYGANTIQLTDSAGNQLLDQPSPGTPVKYKANGGAEVTSTTRTATLAAGLSVDLLKTNATGAATTVTVTRSATGVKTSLSAFVDAYNAVVSDLDSNRGLGTGALKGDSVLISVGDALRRMAGYESGASGLSSLTSLGLTFDSSGKLSLDSTVFTEATGPDLSGLTGFLGTTTGDGFLKTATDIMSSLEDATNGIIKSSVSLLQTQMTDQDARIASEQAKIDQLTTDTQARMAAADALIAQMEQQVSYFSSMFEAMNAANNSY